jgi:hypothetical protein
MTKTVTPYTAHSRRCATSWKPTHGILRHHAVTIDDSPILRCVVLRRYPLPISRGSSAGGRLNAGAKGKKVTPAGTVVVKDDNPTLASAGISHKPSKHGTKGRA